MMTGDAGPAEDSKSFRDGPPRKHREMLVIAFVGLLLLSLIILLNLIIAVVNESFETIKKNMPSYHVSERVCIVLDRMKSYLPPQQGSAHNTPGQCEFVRQNCRWLHVLENVHLQPNDQ